MPQVSGILNNISGVNGPNSPLLWSNVHKIKVLFDETYTLSYKGGATLKAFRFEVPKEKLSTVQFNSTSMNPQENGIYLITISDDQAVPYPVADWWSELRYTDA